ncbi:conserved hypothetical protein [delta proteobacterium NaphS2]|nr:conserved hypothetical protein [delta proteobacterium NaphS2]
MRNRLKRLYGKNITIFISGLLIPNGGPKVNVQNRFAA